MAADVNSARITGKVQGRDIVLYGRLSKEEIRDTVWWWQDDGHEYDASRTDVIATLGGYYQVPRDSRTPEAADLVDLVHTELNPDD
ncbi:hypothetical protein ABZ619_08870 [Streptomyces sp. NPDC007851]|uniref:hypothetical protein n=1 Tax=Streptomyces sp. NPDC007851 TaxID=3155008 RepID=UPI0033FE1564